MLFSAASLLHYIAPTKEASNIVPSSSSRPADILLPNLVVSIISPLQQLTLAEAASSPGHALSFGV